MRNYDSCRVSSPAPAGDGRLLRDRRGRGRPALSFLSAMRPRPPLALCCSIPNDHLVFASRRGTKRRRQWAPTCFSFFEGLPSRLGVVSVHVDPDDAVLHAQHQIAVRGPQRNPLFDLPDRRPPAVISGVALEWGCFRTWRQRQHPRQPAWRYSGAPRA